MLERNPLLAAALTLWWPCTGGARRTGTTTSTATDRYRRGGAGSTRSSRQTPRTCPRAPMLLLAGVTIAASLAGPPAPAPLECGMRKLAMKHAQEMQPSRDHSATFDALELGSLCGVTPPPPGNSAAAHYPLPAGALHVAAAPADRHGRVADGSERFPFLTVGEALQSWRRLHSGSVAPPPIVLHEGVHFLNETIELTSADSGLTIQSAPGAAGKAWLSGGKPLGTLRRAWREAEGMPKGVYVASLAGVGLERVPGLFTLDSHERLTRARFPNADVETAQWVRNIRYTQLVPVQDTAHFHC
jgi:hypothetical protein